MISGAIAIEKEEADRVLKYLFKIDSVNKSLKIKLKGDRVIIPVKSIPGRFKDNFIEEEFESRSIERSPGSVIKENLMASGVSAVRIPEKWIKYGNSVVIRSQCSQREIKLIAQEFVRVLKADTVYNWDGIIKGVYRAPSLRRVVGKGGEVMHLENGVIYIFDPEKVMFSPGNVNERVSVREENVRDLELIDMFSGLGYFTLGLAVYGRPRAIHACDINPDAAHYLERNASLNGVDEKIKVYIGDSRVVLPNNKVDLIIMGNFKSVEYLPHALKRLKNGGKIILHHLVSTENLQNSPKILCRKIKRYGYNPILLDSHIVKSYGPNFWHVSTKIMALKGGDFG